MDFFDAIKPVKNAVVESPYTVHKDCPDLVSCLAAFDPVDEPCGVGSDALAEWEWLFAQQMMSHFFSSPKHATAQAKNYVWKKAFIAISSDYQYVQELEKKSLEDARALQLEMNEVQAKKEQERQQRLEQEREQRVRDLVGDFELGLPSSTIRLKRLDK